MPAIDINETLLERLENMAKPLAGSTDTALKKLLDCYDALRELTAKAGAENQGEDHSDMLYFDAANLPDVTHSKVLSCTFGSSHSDEKTWDELQKLALTVAAAECKSRDELGKRSGANITPPGDNRKQYTEVTTERFCFQRLGAKRVMEVVRKCAEITKCSVTIKVEWLDKDDAAHPGRQAIIKID